ncbi:MAG: GTPase ObgE [Candidatus Omnitrophota bacterium]
MFIDQAKIYVKAGSGGKGCNSFYRDKYSRGGIPDGGSAGDGADIVIRADRNLHTLLDFKYNRHFTGSHGGHGSGNNKKGKDAPRIIIRVPCGTTVKDLKTDCLLRDLEKDQDEFVVARGGSGGRGNKHCREAETGELGEEREIFLDLKLIAEVGIVGFPNVGKSTLISRISNARPQIASYPFTTKFPVLGVVRSSQKSFVIADIPGLIEGSSQSRGLGDKFLRHVERTKILIHVVDMSGVEGRDPLQDYKIINRELKSYAKGIEKKPQVIAANKMDLEGAKENLKRFNKAVRKKVYCISALKHEGLKELVETVARKL